MSVEIISKVANPVHCSNCDSIATIKYGTYKGVQRYYCKVCNRKFKADDTLFHMKLDTNLISSALNMYYEGMSIKAIRRYLLQEHNHAPSTATIYEWIQKYTQYATDSIKDYHPKVGNVWVADETVLKIDGQNTWFWDLMDSKTKYLLSSRVSRSRTTRDAQILMDRAIKTAGKAPQTVLTDKLASYLDVDYGKETEHQQGSPFRFKETGESTAEIERFHGTLKARTKVMRGLKNIETAVDFTQGWLAHYNYLRPHEGLNDKTPAQEAGLAYPYRNWQDIIRNHTPSVKVIIEHQPRDRVKLPIIQVGRPRRNRISQLTSKVTPKPPRFAKGDYYTGKGMISRHPFKGGRARRGRLV
ncbi:MAG: IS1/IS6 family transposase [Chloroflexi bacterium]|nr:IS1/IS6 family transposase [Chloroflexota bacterium]